MFFFFPLADYSFCTLAQLAVGVKFVSGWALALIRSLQIDTGVVSTLLTNKTLVHV